MDQFVLDELPDNAGHLIAVEFDDSAFNLDLGHVVFASS
ncbi:NADP-dependent isocitrate dehydrogenase domain protein [Rhodococcus sp. MTM3W5.2]|nr:NADP-dependent isocitrate dehydrogenase domain protein [Rhodococcus sp. MTM3W5.2]